MTAAITSGIGPLRQRAVGCGEIGVIAGHSARALQHLYQQGSARIRLPASPPEILDAVLLNTAGGLTGDDRLHWSVDAAAGSRLRVSTAAAEKVYRTHGPVAQVSSRLRIADDAIVEWVPQETILFDRSALARTVDVDLASRATLLMVESTILGRQSMGESLQAVQFSEQWRVRRDGRLLHAESVRIDERVLRLAGQPSVLGGRRAFATVLFCSPDPTELLEARARRIRILCLAGDDGGSGDVTGGVSVLPTRLVVRLLAVDSRALRQALIPLIETLSSQLSVPRVWLV